MLKNISIYLIGIIFFCTSSCTNDVTSKERNNTNNTIFEINAEDGINSKIYFEDMIDSVEVTPINNKVLIGHIDKMVPIGDSLFVCADTKYSKTLFILNLSGEIIHTHNYFGKGPKQGQYLHDIYFDESNNNIRVLFHNPNQVLTFDLQLNYISSKSIKSIYRICSDSKYYFYEYGYTNSKLYFVDDWKDELKELKNFDVDGYDGFYNTPAFYKLKDNLYFNIPHDSIVYSLKNGILEKKLKMSYPRIPDNQVVDESKPLAKKYPPVIKKIIEFPETLLIQYTYNWMVRIAILSKRTGEVKYQGKLIDKLFLKGRNIIEHNNAIYSIMTADRFLKRKYYIEINNIKKAGPKIIHMQNLDSLNENSNPVILKYYIKKSIQRDEP